MPSLPPTPVTATDDTSDARPTMNPRRFAVGCIPLLFAGVLGYFAVVCCSGLFSDDPVTVAPPPVAPTPTYTEYTVKPGDFLIKIADDHQLPWQALMLENEPILAQNAKDCYDLPADYVAGQREVKKRGKVKKVERSGYYCNSAMTLEGQPMISANSLEPGDVLHIPIAAPPAYVASAVASLDGQNIVIVVDDTGSMSEERQQVSAWFMAATENSGKSITKVVLYADGNVRELEPSGVEFLTSGQMENTCGALLTALGYNPDAIVLVSDEPGDDWSGWRCNLGQFRLPPVVAYSLDRSADENLKAVADRTGGIFLSNLDTVALVSNH